MTDAAMTILAPDLCVIGAGAGGLSVAASAALMGVPVVLIERGAMGGDCLNHGCVPSKALIAAAETAERARHAGRFGVHLSPPSIDRAGVNAHIRAVIDAIKPVDSQERYRALGATVITGEARFIDARTVQVGDTTVKARRFVIATGSRPVVPPIPGLADAGCLTNETVFDLDVIPPRLVILGGGPIGIELAQAHRRLGAEVTVIEAASILAREDAEAVLAVRTALMRDGVQVIEGATVTRVSGAPGALALDLSGEGVPSIVQASHILVAAGRRPDFTGLGLEAAGIVHDARGITVDAAMRTSNARVFAIGDCAGGPQFTHSAGHQAGLVIRKALFRLPVRFEARAIPRVTFTDPEIAVAGWTEREARDAGLAVTLYRWPFAENDRARATGHTEGFVKALVDRKSRIVGVTIVGAHAGELLAPWLLAMRQRLKISAMVDLVLPYPTLSEASRRAALQSLTPHLRSPWLRRILVLLRTLG